MIYGLARYSSTKIRDFITNSINASNSQQKGKILEDFMCYIFDKIPGIKIPKRNIMNNFQTEEIDIFLWNNRSPRGLYFYPPIIPVECKNWTKTLGSSEVSYFIAKIRNRGCDHGLLIATNGITGSSGRNTGAFFEISNALRDGIRVIFITQEEILNIITTDDLISIIQEKLTELVIRAVHP